MTRATSKWVLPLVVALSLVATACGNGRDLHRERRLLSGVDVRRPGGCGERHVQAAVRRDGRKLHRERRLLLRELRCSRGRNQRHLHV